MENKLFTIVNKEDETRFLADLNANRDNFTKKLKQNLFPITTYEQTNTLFKNLILVYN